MGKYITVEETLTSGDLPEAILPHLLASEVLEGARIPLVWSQFMKDNYDLIGKDGTVLKFMKSTQIGATDVDADTFEASPSFSLTEPTLTALAVTVTELMYCAFAVSKKLTEDLTTIDIVRYMLQSAGKAIVEKLNEDIRDLFITASGCETFSTDTLSYDNVIDSKEKLKNSGWVQGDLPFLVIAPCEESELVKDSTKFTDSIRYSMGDLTKMVDGEIGIYAGCRVIVDPSLKNESYAFIIASTDEFGSKAEVVWKRRLQTNTEYSAKTEETFTVLTARYVCAMLQPKHFVRISISVTP